MRRVIDKFEGLPIPKSLLLKWTRRNKQKFKLWKLLSSNRNRRKIIRANLVIAEKLNRDGYEFAMDALKHRMSLCSKAELAYRNHGCVLGIM